MYLGGQGGQRGYAMAAVLVAIAVLGVVMSALLPVWRQQSQREKEAELLFRLSQYSRAIEMYQARNRAYPPSIDILVQQKYLRKKWKNPITGEDFLALSGGQQPGMPNPPVGGRGGQPGGQNPPGGRGGQPQQQGPQGTGIVRVVSRSKETSIRNQRGATTYDQWVVTSADAPPGPGMIPGRGGQPGMGNPGAQQPGPGRGNQPGGRGRSNQPPTGGRGPGGMPGGRGGG